MSFDSIPDLLKQILEAQKATNASILTLADALAASGKAKATADKVIKKAKDDVKATVDADAQAYAEQKAVTTEPADPDEIPKSYEDAKAVILELSKTKGRDAALSILSQFGVTKLPDLDPVHFAGVCVAATEALQA